MDDDLADLFDKFMDGKGYTSRPEAIRDLLRDEIERDGIEDGTALECVGALSYVYNHHERQLASRLAALHHDHHDITVAATHAHLDHDNCIETVVLRGKTDVVTRFAESVIAEKGVRHGKLNAIPVEADARAQSRGRKRAQTQARTAAHERSALRAQCLAAVGSLVSETA